MLSPVISEGALSDGGAECVLAESTGRVADFTINGGDHSVADVFGFLGIGAGPGSDVSDEVFDQADYDHLYNRYEGAIMDLRVAENITAEMGRKVGNLQAQVEANQAALIAAQEQVLQLDQRFNHVECEKITESEEHQRIQKASDEQNRGLSLDLEELKNEHSILVHQYQMRGATFQATDSKNEYLERKVRFLEDQFARVEAGAKDKKLAGEKLALEKLAKTQKSTKKAILEAQKEERIRFSEKCQEVTKEKVKLADLGEQLKHLHDDLELKDLQNSINSVRINYLEGLNLDLRSKTANLPILEAGILELRKHMTDQTITVPLLLAEIKNLEKQLDDRESTLQQLNTKVMQLMEQNRGHRCFTMSMELNHQLKKAREDVAERESILQDLRGQYAIASQRLEVISKENGTLRTKNAVLQQQSLWNRQAERNAAYQIMDLENTIEDLQGEQPTE